MDLPISLDDGYDVGFELPETPSGFETVTFTWVSQTTTLTADLATIVQDFDLSNGVTLTRTVTIEQDATYAMIVDEYYNPTEGTQTFTVDYLTDTGMNSDNEWFLPGYSATWFTTSTGDTIPGTVPIKNYILARNYYYPGDDPGDSHDFMVWDTAMTLIYFEEEDGFIPVYDLSIPPGGSETLTFYQGMTNTDSESQDIAEQLSVAPPPRPVGGEILPVNKLQLIAPHLLILALAVAGTVGILLKKRIP